MKKIAYIVPYFGKLPKNFKLWLISCKTNSTIDWLIYTDDKTIYDYPENVKVTYCSFDDMKNKIKKIIDFDILIDKPWKLCDFRVAYGEIFKDELKEYDFWGHCDLDLMWGNIRKFITEDILDKYEKIGFQGHSTLYKNDDKVNSRYRTEIKGIPTYKEIFTSNKGYCFDENIICEMYEKLEIPYYKKVNFANLRKYDYNFFLGNLPKEEGYKNKNQIFIWDKGTLCRKFLLNEEIITEEFMYIHFFCRPMTYKANKFEITSKYIIYPDNVIDYQDNIKINYKFVKSKSKKRRIIYYVKAIYYNRKKITIKRIIFNIRNKRNKIKMRKMNKES